MSSKSADLFGRQGKWLLGDSRLSHFRQLCCRQHHLMSHCSWCFSQQSMNLIWIPNVERICVLTSLLVKIIGCTTSFVTIFSTKKKSFSATNVQEYKNTFLLGSVIFWAFAPLYVTLLTREIFAFYSHWEFLIRVWALVSAQYLVSFILLTQ